jgi:hypothetical protein
MQRPRRSKRVAVFLGTPTRGDRATIDERRRAVIVDWRCTRRDLNRMHSRASSEICLLEGNPTRRVLNRKLTAQACALYKRIDSLRDFVPPKLDGVGEAHVPQGRAMGPRLLPPSRHSACALWRPTGRRPLPRHLPRRRIDIDVPEAGKHCACGRRSKRPSPAKDSSHTWSSQSISMTCRCIGWSRSLRARRSTSRAPRCSSGSPRWDGLLESERHRGE